MIPVNERGFKHKPRDRSNRRQQYQIFIFSDKVFNRNLLFYIVQGRHTRQDFSFHEIQKRAPAG